MKELCHDSIITCKRIDLSWWGCKCGLNVLMHERHLHLGRQIVASFYHRKTGDITINDNILKTKDVHSGSYDERIQYPKQREYLTVFATNHTR